MSPWIIAMIVTAVLLALMVVLYFVGNKMQKKQLEQKEMLYANAQPTSMLIIDKKVMPLKDAHLPKSIMDQLTAKGKRYAKAKVPVVKAKVGPQIVSLICDDAIFDEVPERGEVKAMVSGIYIVGVKQIHGKKKKGAVEEEPKKKKFSLRQKLIKSQAEYQKELSNEIASKKEKEAEKKAKEKQKKIDERAKKITV